MYKVLIIDDEPLARLGLKETIDWTEFGFEVVGDADNAVVAMDLYDKFNPDVVITDICMDPIDGLTLIEALKKRNTDLEFIVISGYNDFTYAQTAIKYGVSTYILKPIENEDLHSALTLLKEKLDKRSKINRIISEYTDKQNESILSELLTSNNDIEEKYKLFSSEGYEFPENKKFVVISAQINDSINESSDNSKELIVLLKDIAQKEFETQGQLFLSTITKNNRIIFVIFEDKKKKLDPKSTLMTIANKFTLESKKTLSIGISNVMHNVSMLPKGYMQAKQAHHAKFPATKNTVHVYTANEGSSVNSSPAFLTISTEDLLESIILNKNEKAKNIIDSYFEQSKGLLTLNLDDVKNTIISVAVYIIGRYITTPEMAEMIFKRVIHPAKEIWNLESLEEVHAWISNFVETLINNKQVKGFSNYSPLVKNAITYIMLNYADNCDAKLAADHLFVSTGHLMRQFKQETGKTFLEYLTEYRISIAVTLLQDGNYRIYEVAEKVGYTDTKHFGKVFKSITGKSPKELRN